MILNFQGVNRHFVLPIENETQRISYNRYYLPSKEIKSYNVMIDGKNIFDQLIRNNSQKIVTGQEYDYTIICLLD